MRIALVNNTFEPFAVGGAERSMLARAKGLMRRGHEVKVFSLAADGIQAERSIGGVDVSYILGAWGASSPWHKGRSALQRLLWHVGPEWVPFGRTDLAPAIQSFSPDVVNMANLPGLGYGNVEAVRHLGVPVVLTVADFAPLCAGTTMFRKTEQCEERCLKCRIISGPRLSRFNRADAYIFVSEYMRNRYVATNGHADEAMSRGSVIHNGLDDCMINMPLPPTIEARSSAVGFMGQLKPTKGIEVLIRAFLKGAERREARLVIAGSGETAYVEALKRLAGGDRRVEFIGHSDPVRFFERVDIVVIPSVWAEPLPRVGYEANFFGRPIIVSNKGGCSELVENDENGSVFDPDHDMQLSGLIDVWFARLQRHRSEISQAARAHALKRHHPDIVAQRYEDALTASTRVPAGKAA